jgi:hypothetical protein
MHGERRLPLLAALYGPHGMTNLSPEYAPKRTPADLVIVDQHPSKSREPDHDGDRNCPPADADIADGLPRTFILGDLAIALLAFPGRVGHGLPSCRETP